MTREEYEDLRTEVSESGRTLKSVLSERGIAYSTYNYWRRKAASLSPHQPLAPISVKGNSPCTSPDAYILVGGYDQNPWVAIDRNTQNR